MNPSNVPTELPDIDPEAIAGASVLLVDDHEQNLELLQAYLEELGCSIAMARDGMEAVEAIEQNPPDLVLLDLMLPKLDGFSVLRGLRADRLTAPVVILSARGEEWDRIQGFEVGADDYVVKPFSMRELVPA